MAGRGKTAQAAFDIAQPIAEQMGLELVDAEYKKEGKDTFLRLYIDRKGGLGIDDCEEFSRTIDPILDEKLKHDADYFEVSSPGLTRPLTTPADYRRYEGEKLDVTLFKPIEDSKNLTASIKNGGDTEVTLIREDGSEITIEYKEIAKAVRHIEF